MVFVLTYVRHCKTIFTCFIFFLICKTLVLCFLCFFQIRADYSHLFNYILFHFCVILIAIICEVCIVSIDVSHDQFVYYFISAPRFVCSNDVLLNVSPPPCLLCVNGRDAVPAVLTEET